MAVTTNFGYGVDVENYETKINSTYQMIEKIARQVLRNVETEDRLAIFNKEPINNGTTIEEVVVGLLEAQGYSQNVTEFMQKATANLYVKYYQDWTPLKFETGFTEDEIRKVTLAGGRAEDLSERIVASLSESDKQDRYERVLGLLNYASSVPTRGDSDYDATSPQTEPRAMVNVGSIDLTAQNGYKDLLTMIKNTVSGMRFVNDKFNSAKLKRGTRADDIIMLIPYSVKNALDVNELAAVFNLSKDEIEARIIDIDVDGKIYIVDRNAVLMMTRLYRMTSWFNPDMRYYNFWLHVDRMYAMSTLWDSCFITIE